MVYEMERFPRGSGPLVSVLLPSRGRPQLLRESLESLFTTADNQSNLEVIVKVDGDDQETFDAANEMFRKYPYIKCYSTPRGNGYWDLADWLNVMANNALGDWLYVFNDDAKMLVKGWDSLLERAKPPNPAARAGIFAFATPVRGVPHGHQFMFVRREMVQYLGHLTKIPGADTYVWSVLAMVEAVAFSGIEVEHMGEAMNDSIAQDRKNQVDQFMMSTMFTPTILAKVADVLLLQAKIDSQIWFEVEENRKEEEAKRRALNSAITYDVIL